METEMTEKERQAIGQAIRKHWDYIHEEDLISDILLALSELRKPSEGNRARIMELLWVFSCDGTTDPKEITEEIIRAAQNCRPNPSNICPECGYPKNTQGNGIVERICTCGEPPEYIGQQKIHQCKVCGLIYDNSTELYEHYNETHNNPIE